MKKKHTHTHTPSHTHTIMTETGRRAALNNMEKGDNGFPALAVCLKVWWMKHVWKDD